MNAIECRAAFSLAAIMSLRMLGLFMVLPVLSLYASHLPYATPFLIGLSLGIYGLTQGIFQIPFGMLSDYFGRKKLIALGLIIFAAGSMIAAVSHTIFGMILGRALQGTGAVGSTIIAMLADLTHENERTKAMAIVGITIGLSFLASMILGPLLASWISIPGIFWLAVLLSGAALLLLIFYVPVPAKEIWHADTEPDMKYFFSLLKDAQLLALNLGIFLLHAILTASFVIIPLSLQKAGLQNNQQWMLYLPVLILSFVVSLILIIFSERKHWQNSVFTASIALLGISELLLWIFSKYLLIFAVGLLLFFTAFSLLEAFLPSRVSKMAPPQYKGTALGIYSCSQFLGIFVGGSLGGLLYGALGLTDVYLFCVALTIVWLIIAFKMKYRRPSWQKAA